MQEWFHNNTRNVASKTGTGTVTAVLDLKLKPKMLQAWQAYHALTYEKQWKLQVDKLWETYKTEWESKNANLDEKPPKSQLQLMNEFMREQYQAADEDMKKQCEAYQRSRKESPVATGSEADRNLEFQK